MRIRNHRRRTAAATIGLAAVATAALVAATTSSSGAAPTVDQSAHTSTPIKHLVVIFDENVSYDHYFGTYP